MALVQELTFTAKVMKSPTIAVNKFNSKAKDMTFVVELAAQPYPDGEGETHSAISKFIYVNYTIPSFDTTIGTKVVEGSSLLIRARLTGTTSDDKYPVGYYVKASDIIVLDDSLPIPMMNRATARCKIQAIVPGEIPGTTKFLFKETKRIMVDKDKPQMTKEQKDVYYASKSGWHFYMGVLNSSEYDPKIKIDNWYFIQGRLAKNLVNAPQDADDATKKRYAQPLFILDRIYLEK